nr:hypothetical protein [Micromonospora sp. DSM 115978]
MTAGVTTVVCGYCHGLTYVPRACDCRDGDGERVDYTGLTLPTREHRQPWTGCRQCRGVGTYSQPCVDCGQLGRRRAQLVYTVANLDTGQVASVNVIPGAVEPAPTPDGRWWLPLGLTVTDLAERIGVAAGTLRAAGWPGDPLATAGVVLPRDWRPDLPVERRHQLEAAAIAGASRPPWRVLLGHTSLPEPPDHARMLGRLCALADQLHLDVVVEARRSDATRTGLNWDVRFELAGGGVPANPSNWAALLDDALAAVTPEKAAAGLTRAAPDTPAYFLHTDAVTARPAVGINGYLSAHDVDQLERRIIADAERGLGAQAIWRNRHWWHLTLQPDEPVPTAVEMPTGQVAHRSVDTLRRGWEPPVPHHRGDPIPTAACPRCPGGAGHDGGDDRPYCPDCRGTGHIRRGAVLTITDLRGRCLHRNWRPDDETPPGAVVASYGSTGSPVVQLPTHYRIGALAAGFDVRPTDLTDIDGERVLDQHLRDGIVHVLAPATDPLTSYLAKATNGRPGARVIVRANDWGGPSLDELARLVVGLGIGIEVTAVDHRLNVGKPHLLQGESWSVRIVDPDLPIEPDSVPTSPGPAAAVAACLRGLASALNAVTPTDPEQPIPVPQQPTTTGPAPDLTGLIPRTRTLAAHYPGRLATIRLDPTGHRTALTE